MCRPGLSAVAAFLLVTPAPARAAPEPPAPVQERPVPTEPAPQAEPGSELRVWLVTAAPGTAVWERFGHNAIRVLDTRTGQDVSYNWGIFDFDQVDFIPRFLKGQMLYMMAPFRTAPMIDSYTRAGRPVSLQELALTPAQRDGLRDFLAWNALPENREYFYDYFLDNCSTRARDALDRVLGGALSARFADAETGTSYRYHTRRLTRMDPLLYTGMDLLLGTPGDQPITVWQEMFLPMTLMEAVREITVTGPDGTARPLVMDERVLEAGGWEPTAVERGADPDAPGVEGTGGGGDGPAHPWGPPTPPSWLVFYLALGVALGGAMAWLGTGAARASAAAATASAVEGAPGGRALRVGAGALASIWSVAAGFVGTVLVLVLFTDHQFMAWNENLFLFTPLSWGLAVLAPLALAGKTGVRAARALGWTVVGVAVLGLLVQLLPQARQQNAIFFALALPVHLGLAWSLERRLREGAPEAAA